MRLIPVSTCSRAWYSTLNVEVKSMKKTNNFLVLCVNRSNFFSTSPPGSVEVHQRFKREDGDEERR
jgi:hypothetical protein